MAQITFIFLKLVAAKLSKERSILL